jgi:hypothetical protein
MSATVYVAGAADDSGAVVLGRSIMEGVSVCQVSVASGLCARRRNT